MTTMVFDALTPAKCWMAPEIPIAIYRLGLTAMPVWPTCSAWGRQPASDTGFEQAVAAPSASANSSMIPQFSGPFNPLPPDTTISASGKETLSVARIISFTTVVKSSGEGWFSNATISASTGLSLNSKAFAFKAITLTAEFNSVTANALPENAVFLTRNILPSIVGNSTTPFAKPATSFAASRGANPLPLNELDSTTMDEFSCLAAASIMDA